MSDHQAQGNVVLVNDRRSGAAAPQRYEIRVRGHLGEAMRAAFPALVAEARHGYTRLTGAIADQAALHGVLSQIESLGLELLEIRRLRASPNA
jgi:hypothetical protein